MADALNVVFVNSGLAVCKFIAVAAVYFPNAFWISDLPCNAENTTSKNTHAKRVLWYSSRCHGMHDAVQHHFSCVVGRPTMYEKQINGISMLEHVLC